MTKTRKQFGLLLGVLGLVLGMAGGAGAQNPGGITTAPVEWLRAGDIMGATDAGALASWTASAGQAMSQSVAARQPVYHAGTTTGALGPNSKPYVTFTGQQGLYTNALTQAAGNYTCFAVVRIPDASDFHWLFDTQSGRFVIYPNTTAIGPGGGWYDAGSFHAPAPPSSLSAGSFVIYSWVFSGTTGTMYVNGTQVGTAAYAAEGIGGITAIGNAEDTASTGGTAAGLGDTAEFILEPAALSAADQTAVGSYLASKYSLTYAGSSAPAPTTTNIAPDNVGFFYSPYNWAVSASTAETINSGAYFRTLLGGTATCSIGLNIGAATPYSEVYARLSSGAWQKYTPTAAGAQSWALTMPTGSTAGKYLLEVLVKSTTETQDRWNSQTTAVQFTGLTLDSGGATTLPAARKYRVLIYGDSITEGVRVNGYSGITNDTDRNDNTLDYSYKLGGLLDAEVGVVGFGATGVTVGGSGNVPALPTSYNQLWSGQARVFSPVPDLVIYNETTNESGAALSALQPAFSAVINGIGYAGTANTFSGLNGTRHLILQPFGGYQAANLQTIASGFGSANVVYGSTAGLFSSADSSDGLHPYGYAHLGTLAPGVAALALPLLRPAAMSVIPIFSRQPSRGR